MYTLRVLCVDDEEGMRLGVSRALRRFTVDLPEIDDACSFEVAVAETGEEGMEMIRAETPDILLLDHKLPGMSGLDVLEQIDADAMRMLTVMITAYASLETAVTAIKRGAYDFLAKPFTPAELKATVRKAATSLIMARHARKLAKEKRQVRFQFISVLSHELKAPLNAIDGYLKLLADHTLGDDIGRYDKMIDRSALRIEHMRKLIHDLLDLTRIESGQKKRELADIDLRPVAERAIETAQPAADERDIDIALNAEGDLTLRADEGELEIILNNLVSNAVKYNRDGGEVTLALTGADDTVRIAVADTGIGMTPEEQEKLFDEFVRIKNDKTRNILGSGLGLNIVRRLARLYGGEVSAESEPDVGSTFTVTLQRRPPEQKPEPEADDGW